MSKPDAPKESWQAGCVTLVVTLGVLFLAFFMALAGLGFLLEMGFHALCGWIFYLVSTLPKAGFNLEMILCGLGALALAVWLAHRFIRWFRDPGDDQREREPWPLSATFACTALLLLMFGAAIAITGIVHQTGWLMREKLVESSLRKIGMSSKALQMASQLHKGILVTIQDTGSAPQSLEEMRFEFGLDDLAEFRTYFNGPLPDGDRWLYFPDAMASSDDMKVVLVSPKPIGNRWIVIHADGSGETPKTLHGLDLPFHPAPALDPMPAAER